MNTFWTFVLRLTVEIEMTSECFFEDEFCLKYDPF